MHDMHCQCQFPSAIELTTCLLVPSTNCQTRLFLVHFGTIWQFEFIPEPLVNDIPDLVTTTASIRQLHHPNKSSSTHIIMIQPGPCWGNQVLITTYQPPTPRSITTRHRSISVEQSPEVIPMTWGLINYFDILCTPIHT